MLNFEENFLDKYQFTLKDVNFHLIEEKQDIKEIRLNIHDDLVPSIKDNQLVALFSREIFFEPSALFNLKVDFEMKLTFKDDLKLNPKDINWREELVHNPNPFIGNLISRASNLISTITLIQGQSPIITPPTFIAE